MLKTASLTPAVYDIVCRAGTELAQSGAYNLHTGKGTYCCRQCGIALFRSSSKFISSCGWPSFDDEIKDRIKRLPDDDGRRTEIRCQHCDAHLGHVFMGEGYTQKNRRHCVNSAAIDFVASVDVDQTEEAIVAGGCFWGVESLFKKLPGVLLAEVGYTGGDMSCPTYEQVCHEETGHVEAVRIVYDRSIVEYEEIIKYFLEIHDPTQATGQGPDLGSQYLSKIFCYDQSQKDIALSCLQILRDKGFNVATEILAVSVFWPAEQYHQGYYDKSGKTPYCHFYTSRF